MLEYTFDSACIEQICFFGGNEMSVVSEMKLNFVYINAKK